MSLASLLNTSQVTIRPYVAGIPDSYGNVPGSWGAGTAVRGWIEQSSSSEQLESGDRTVSQWRLFLPAGTAVGPLDRVVDDTGRLFEISGEPESPRTPRGVHHMVMSLIRVVG